MAGIEIKFFVRVPANRALTYKSLDARQKF